MKILKVNSVEELLQAPLEGVTEIQAMDMCLDELPQDFFLRAKSLEILYLKSSWCEAGLPDIPGTVRQLFCCNWGRGRSGYGYSRNRYTPPKQEKKPVEPTLPPTPEDTSKPTRTEHEGSKYDWNPETQKWVKVVIDLDAMPAGLIKFYASEVAITGSLDFSRFTAMEELILNQCEIEEITAWPPNVRWIYANWNKLETVPDFPSTVKFVELNDNQLTVLPKISHTNLVVLRVDKNKLTTIQDFSPTLEELRAENNQLVSLPKKVPAGMLRLYVRFNKLQALPLMEHSVLEELFCGFNKLTFLPTKPLTLEQLYCHDNRLRSLGVLHEGMLEIYCGYNKLNEHPKLPTTCTEFNGVGNNFGEMQQYVAQVHMLRYQMNDGLVRKNLA